MRTKTAITAIITLLAHIRARLLRERDAGRLHAAASMDTFLDITLWNPKNAEESKTACENRGGPARKPALRDNRHKRRLGDKFCRDSGDDSLA